MTLTLAGLALAGLAIISLGGIVRALIRAQERERGTLVSQILYLSGRTWDSPPAAAELPAEDDEPDERDLPIGDLLPEHINY